jgi:hypothetical protein
MKKARILENLTRMVEKQKRNKTHSQEENNDCKKHEQIEEEQKKKTEHIVTLIDSIVVNVTRMTNSNVDSSNECVGLNSLKNDHN